MDIANASMLDEGSAASEAMQMSFNIHNGKRKKYYVSHSMFPQTIDVIRTKAEALGIELEVGDIENFHWIHAEKYCGIIVQNPDNLGNVTDYEAFSKMI